MDSAFSHPETIVAPGVPVGLVAGNGPFPGYFIRNATSKGHPVIVVAHRDETSEDELETASAVVWLRVGQLRSLLKAFEKHGVRDIAFLGGIRKARLMRTLRPDWLAMRFLCTLATTNDNDLLSSLATFFEQRGLRVFDPTIFLGECRVPRGVFSQRAPHTDEQAQAAIGWRAAHAVGAADIGQAVVVAAGSIIAVEAIEGTDELLRRAGTLVGRHSGVLVKRVKPQQDLRLDLPTIGPTTVKNAAAANIKCIVVEAGQTLLVDPLLTVRTANELGVCLIGAHGAELVL